MKKLKKMAYNGTAEGHSWNKKRLQTSKSLNRKIKKHVSNNRDKTHCRVSETTTNTESRLKLVWQRDITLSTLIQLCMLLLSPPPPLPLPPPYLLPPILQLQITAACQKTVKEEKTRM